MKMAPVSLKDGSHFGSIRTMRVCLRLSTFNTVYTHARRDYITHIDIRQ